MSAGPKLLAGFMDAPVNGMAISMFAVTTMPIVTAAGSFEIGLSDTAENTVKTSTKVSANSIITPSDRLIPSTKECAPVAVSLPDHIKKETDNAARQEPLNCPAI